VDRIDIAAALRRMLEKIQEIQKLYDLSEAETVLLIQLIELMARMNWSKKLTIKLLNTAAAVLEATQEDSKIVEEGFNKKR